MGFEHKKYEVVARDNTYNQENDFNHDFTWSVWANKPNGDWCWDSDLYVAVCQHYGGDPRNNWYSTPKLFAVDSIADSGFFDWVLGWGCSWSRCHEYLDCEPSELDDEKAREIVGETFDDQHTEKINERCSIGYSQNPTCELDDHLDDGDECYWFDGRAIVRMDGKWLVCCPYHYHAEINTPDNGNGWLWNCSISFDSFIESVFDSSDFMEDIDSLNPEIEIDGESMKHDWEGIEWDNDDRISEVIAQILFNEYVENGGEV